jgi:hypothetical protein
VISVVGEGVRANQAPAALSPKEKKKERQAGGVAGIFFFFFSPVLEV